MRLQNLVWTVALSALAAAWTAADNSGSILITVTGPDRSAITGAAVEVVSRSLIAARTTATDARGKVLLVGLLPGRYRLRVTRAGYEAAQRDVGLLQDRTVELVIPLRVEAVRETVMVSEPLPTVDTRSATVAAHITAEQVEAVPVGRDYRAYEQLVPGVNVVPNSDGIETRYEPASKSGNFFYDRGAAMGSRDNTYLLDGFNITDMAGGTGSLALDNDAILEEEVITSGLPAEYPGGSGSVANIVTRLGGPTTSGSLDYFLQRPSMYAGFATGDSRLRAAREDKHDGGLTIGGPLARDRAWFFAAGQERTNSDDVELSASASPMPRHETYGFRRTNGLGKLTVRPSGDSVLTAVAFADLRRTDGTRDVNTPPNRYADLKDDALTYGLSYQRLLAAGALAELQLFDSRRDASAVPADSGAGPTNTVLYEPGATVPAYLRDLGSSGDPSRTVQRKRQAEIAFTRFVHAFGDHQIKAGVQWQRWEEANSTQRIFGNSMTSLAPPLAGLTLGGARDLNLLPASEADVIYRTLVSAPTSAAFRALDTDHDGVLTPAEFAAAVFGSTAGNAAGVNFLRQQLQYAGVNNVGQTEWAFFLQDEWRLGRWSVAAGARVEKIRYFASDGSTILAMAPAVYPRLGIAWDLKGDGRQKLSFAYGRYSDPLLSPMIRFAGNLSGSIWADEVFLGDSWFSYRTRGSATVARDAGFAPDLKNQVATELQLVYGVNLTPAVGFLAQIYNRREDNLIEDYDPAVYFSPAAGRLALDTGRFRLPRVRARRGQLLSRQPRRRQAAGVGGRPQPRAPFRRRLGRQPAVLVEARRGQQHLERRRQPAGRLRRPRPPPAVHVRPPAGHDRAPGQGVRVVPHTLGRRGRRARLLERRRRLHRIGHLPSGELRHLLQPPSPGRQLRSGGDRKAARLHDRRPPLRLHHPGPSRRQLQAGPGCHERARQPGSDPDRGGPQQPRLRLPRAAPPPRAAPLSTGREVLVVGAARRAGLRTPGGVTCRSPAIIRPRCRGTQSPERSKTLTFLGAEAQASALPFTLPPRWQATRLLGAGGQAEVWLARDLELGEWVAVKVFRDDLSETQRERLRREVRLGRSLSHPNLVRVFELIEAGGRLAVAMEWVSGGSLAARLEDGPLPIGQAIAVADEVLGVLAYLHGQGIVHRDVKPSNLLLDDKGSVRLADLGLVRPLEDGGDLTATAMAVGTPGYMSPEQIRGLDPTPGADLYSLGVTLFHLLTGRMPFAGNSSFEVADQHLHASPPDVRSLRPDCPAWLARFVERLLEKSAGDRWPDAAAALDALRRKRVLASPRFWRRAVLAAAAAVALGGVLFAWVRTHRGVPAAVRITQDQLVVTDARRHELWRRQFPGSGLDAVTGDFLGEGASQVAVSTAPAGRGQPAGTEDIAVFGADGRERARFASVGRTDLMRHFPGVGPTVDMPLLFALDLGGRHPALAWITHSSPWFPSAVGIWDATRGARPGPVLFNSGHITGLRAAALDGGRRELIATGINNRLGYQAVAVILDPVARGGLAPPSPGVSPDLASDWEFAKATSVSPVVAYVPLGANRGETKVVAAGRSGITVRAGEAVVELDASGNPRTSPLFGRGPEPRRRFWDALAAACLEIEAGREDPGPGCDRSRPGPPRRARRAADAAGADAHARPFAGARRPPRRRGGAARGRPEAHAGGVRSLAAPRRTARDRRADGRGGGRALGGGPPAAGGEARARRRIRPAAARHPGGGRGAVPAGGRQRLGRRRGPGAAVARPVRADLGVLPGGVVALVVRRRRRRHLALPGRPRPAALGAVRARRRRGGGRARCSGARRRRRDRTAGPAPRGPGADESRETRRRRWGKRARRSARWRR